jgi:hypothetical protein
VSFRIAFAVAVAVNNNKSKWMKTHTYKMFPIVGLIAAVRVVHGGTFSDDFATGLDASHWSVIQTKPDLYSVDASPGEIRFAKTAMPNPGGVQSVNLRLNFALFGGRITNDFSTQIDFSNAMLPGPGLDQVELHTYYQDGSIYYAVYDNSSGINAHVWDGSGAQGAIPVSGNAGTLRISRTNDTIAAYFNDTPLFSETGASALTGIELVLQNNSGSDDATAVAFDNFSLTAASVSPPPAATGAFYFVSLTNVANFTWVAPDTVPGEPTGTRLPGAPVGLVTLAGIPFNIASNAAGKQAWHADVAVNGGSGPVSITNSVNVYGVTKVYSLINTWCGQPGPTAYAWFVFTGSAGTVFSNALVGGTDIRDYNGATWENNINGTTTVNVFDCLSDNWGSPGWLDMQQITLPPEFATQSLVSIQLVDHGGPSIQRVVLDGLTVQATALPPLSIVANGGQINVSWPALAGVTLQTNSDLATANWMAYGGSVTNVAGTNLVTLEAPTGNLYFRLKQ